MFDSPGVQIWDAIRAILLADPALTALTGVFWWTPEGQPYPYVERGPSSEMSENGINWSGRDTLLQLDLWTRERSMLQGQTLGAAIVKALDHQTLSLADHSVAGVGLEFFQSLADPDPEICHTVVQLRIHTEQHGG